MFVMANGLVGVAQGDQNSLLGEVQGSQSPFNLAHTCLLVFSIWNLRPCPESVWHLPVLGQRTAPGKLDQHGRGSISFVYSVTMPV